jgi:endogenous inhibitor of DNA gyrase (YacG/DUF329 family)
MENNIGGHARPRNNFSNCSHCGAEFRPLRRSARFCSSRCRLISHRSAAARTLPTATETASSAIGSVSRPVGLQNQVTAVSETLRTSRRRDASLPRAIVPDDRWPGMYRVRRPDGSLTDMLNFTRARDALLHALDGGRS